VAASGLEARGYGEEALLEPLRDRVAARSGPADRARTLMARGGVPRLVKALSLA
jgi:hypothetical protein